MMKMDATQGQTTLGRETSICIKFLVFKIISIKSIISCLSIIIFIQLVISWCLSSQFCNLMIDLDGQIIPRWMTNPNPWSVKYKTVWSAMLTWHFHWLQSQFQWTDSQSQLDHPDSRHTKIPSHSFNSASCKRSSLKPTINSDLFQTLSTTSCSPGTTPMWSSQGESLSWWLPLGFLAWSET